MDCSFLLNLNAQHSLPYNKIDGRRRENLSMSFVVDITIGENYQYLSRLLPCIFRSSSCNMFTSIFGTVFPKLQNVSITSNVCSPSGMETQGHLLIGLTRLWHLSDKKSSVSLVCRKFHWSFCAPNLYIMSNKFFPMFDEQTQKGDGPEIIKIFILTAWNMTLVFIIIKLRHLFSILTF